VSWAHFVHHAWTPVLGRDASPLRRLIGRTRSSDARARELRAFKLASLVVTNSDRTSRDVEACGIAPEKIRRVYLGAESTNARVGQVAQGSRAPTLLFLGALGWDARKGLDLVLRAFALISRGARWTHRLVVAGNGSAQPWEALARELGIVDRVDFVGFVEHPEDLLGAADLLLSPVRYEPYGLAIQEALCSGTPALFTRAAGIAERLPPACERMLVPERAGALEWADAISDALENLELFRTSARLAREELLRWSWRDFATAFIELVEHWHDQHLV
jgi:glycosyltransferase involved in cell wall biosynthesis